MSNYKKSLITILKLNSAETLCEDSSYVLCTGVLCSECAFLSEATKEELIKELENE